MSPTTGLPPTRSPPSNPATRSPSSRPPTSASPRHAVGTVVRLAGTHIVVSCKSPRGVRYVHHFARRDGVRIGGGHRAELMNTHAVDAVPTGQRQKMLRVDALFREWTRHRADVDKLRRLRDAISECLDESLVGPQ